MSQAPPFMHTVMEDTVMKEETHPHMVEERVLNNKIIDLLFLRN